MNITYMSPLPSGVINNMGNPHQKSSKCVCFEKIIEVNLNDGDEFKFVLRKSSKCVCFKWWIFRHLCLHQGTMPWVWWTLISSVHGPWWPMGVGRWWVWIKITGRFIFWYWNHTISYIGYGWIYIGYGWIWSTSLISKHCLIGFQWFSSRKLSRDIGRTSMGSEDGNLEFVAKTGFGSLSLHADVFRTSRELHLCVTLLHWPCNHLFRLQLESCR